MDKEKASACSQKAVSPKEKQVRGKDANVQPAHQPFLFWLSSRMEPEMPTFFLRLFDTGGGPVV